MIPKVEDIAAYKFTSSDTLLLDANIWLLNYCPQMQTDRRVRVYSRALNSILAAQCRIFIDVLIVSEFINAYARIKFNLLPKGMYASFKQYRISAAFKPVAKDIAADVKLVLRHCTRIGSGFESLSMDTLLDEYAQGNSDFNDQVFVALSKGMGLKLITDDSDYKDSGIPIITANKQLLS